MDKEKNRIVVPFSRPKLTRLIGIGLAFVVVGLLLIFFADRLPEAIPRWIPIVLGIFALLVFGFISMAILKKLTNKKPGLIIRDDGIWDNSSAIAIGL
ncbi:MAG TPA: STM3941 family protein, partial [Anditalea sp.]|nr:STM3941 family protein [Anditalea sp.]